ncbi:Upc2 protein [Colletotrichum truncatum]|uniref:Upc2 protein n=1 Tax=Colletotrichum truncatum TaxID=5467 RepID=A0ACC3Z517_COLTU|nr:Upc2 protein [Colletotrichum truncatum]KAF6780862.1 Upc2 protein [Colletotrichum truncatum]
MSPPQSARLPARRSHRKSRNGCSGCKKRHIKCDETRPECRNCVMSERACSYLKSDLDHNDSSSSVANGVSAHNNIETRRSLVVPKDPADDLSCIGTTFTVTHMVLLHYAESNMSEYMALLGDVRPIMDVAMEHALTAPYLLDQILALSALHISTQNGANASLYRHQATELQTRALGMFNQAKQHLSDSTYMPTFIFASFLGIHVLHDTLQQHHGTLAGFIENFVTYSRLHRGVRAVTQKYWPQILQSDLKPLLYVASLARKTDTQAPGTETNELREFFKSPTTYSAYTETCIEALKGVQWALDVAKQDPSREELGIHAVMALPLYVTNEYIEALYQQQPEAVVVFAFYAAMLHRYRHYWAFGCCGSSLVHSISRSVGPFWQDMLAWPLQVLNES